MSESAARRARTHNEAPALSNRKAEDAAIVVAGRSAAPVFRRQTTSLPVGGVHCPFGSGEQVGTPAFDAGLAVSRPMRRPTP
jgi:hypothetical protein